MVIRVLKPEYKGTTRVVRCKGKISSTFAAFSFLVHSDSNYKRRNILLWPGRRAVFNDKVVWPDLNQQKQVRFHTGNYCIWPIVSYCNSGLLGKQEHRQVGQLAPLVLGAAAAPARRGVVIRDCCNGECLCRIKDDVLLVVYYPPASARLPKHRVEPATFKTKAMSLQMTS